MVSLAKALAPRQKWEKDEILDVLYFLRQLLGLVIGIACGVVGVQGFVGFVIFAVISTGVIHAYRSSYQAVDVSIVDTPSDLLFEGMKESLFVFIASWVVAYSLL